MYPLNTTELTPTLEASTYLPSYLSLSQNNPVRSHQNHTVLFAIKLAATLMPVLTVAGQFMSSADMQLTV